MAVIIGSARIDEHGNATGGAAGDQKNGKEVSTQNWYLHQKGWRVFRAKNPSTRVMLAYDMKAACNNNNIGYDQKPNPSLFSVAKKFSFDCAKVNVKCETDCSKLVRVCCWYAGIDIPSMTTATEPKVLLATGQFTELTGDKYTKSSDYLMAGDILVTKTRGHTVIVLTDGPKTDKDVPKFDYVEITGNKVFIRKGPGTEYLAVGVAHKGERYPYLHQTKSLVLPDNTTRDWYYIQYDTIPGWVSGKYSMLIT